jgi:SAM-dependent methyltransferase
VLEPGCGSGRMLQALASHGLEVVGIDMSESMLALARTRGGGEVFRADMRNFDLGRRFEGAVRPISTVGLLGAKGLASHLDVVAGHLEPGARYLVQQGVFAADAELWRSEWEAERDGVRLHVVWGAVGRDPARLRERSRSRVEVVAGPRAGEVVEDEHESAFWTVEAWREAIAASPFTEVACFDDEVGVELDRGGNLLWHELVAP